MKPQPDLTEYIGETWTIERKAGKEKPPRKGKHLMLTDSVRDWIGRMEQLPTP